MMMQMPRLPATAPAAVTVFYAQLILVAAALAVLVESGVLIARLRGWRPRPDPFPDRRLLVLGLGALWTLDGLLQMQPQMVTHFLSGVVAPLLQGEPAPLGALIRIGVQIWSVDPATANVMACCVQLLIGLALLAGNVGALRRAALWASIAWGLIVWVVGEAMGGMFVGGGWLTGAPGAALLYVAAAIVALQPDRFWQAGRLRWLAPVGLGAVLLLDAFLQAWPAAGFWAPGTLAGFASSMGQMPQPAVLAAPVKAWAAVIPAAPTLWNLGIVAVLTVLGLGWWVRPGSRPLLIATAAWVALAWYFGQEFGVLGGMGTDPNIGAALLLWLGLYGHRTGAAVSAAAVPEPS